MEFTQITNHQQTEESMNKISSMNWRTTLLAVLSLPILLATASAIPPGTPVNFSIALNPAQNSALLEWSIDPNGGVPHFFTVYYAVAPQQGNPQFHQLARVNVVSHDSGITYVQDYSYHALRLSGGINYFYVTATNPDGTSLPTDTLSVAINAHYSIAFTTQPTTQAVVNQPYSYDANAVYTGGGEVRYQSVSLPQGASIDSISGLLSYTPSSVGTVYFTIKAFLATDTTVSATQHWAVHVVDTTHRSPCIFLHGYVRDTHNNLVMTGHVKIMRLDNPTNSETITIPLRQGFYTATLDRAGTYIISVEGTHFHTQWHHNASTVDSATHLSLQCGDTLRIDFNVTLVSTRLLGGVVTDAVTTSGVPAVISIVSSDQRFSTTTVTDNHGNYQVQIPEGLSCYISARAHSNQYELQYYDRASEILNATVVTLTGDRLDIDFPLVRVPSYNNGISGIVKDTADQPIQALVSAYFIDPNTGHPDYRHAHSVLTDSSTGYYQFVSLRPGSYILLAQPHDRVYRPGYYKSNAIAVTSWLDATVITVDTSGMVTNRDIILGRLHGIRGAGIVQGIIQAEKSGIVATTGIPIANATVLLFDQQGEAITWTTTDANGRYQISDASNGTLTLVVDKVGYDRFSSIVTVKDAIPVEGSAVLQRVQLTSVRAPSGITETIDADVFPNPAAERIHIRLRDGVEAASVQLIDALGRQVYAAEFSNASERTMIVALSSLPTGMYRLVLRAKDQPRSISLMILR